MVVIAICVGLHIQAVPYGTQQVRKNIGLPHTHDSWVQVTWSEN